MRRSNKILLRYLYAIQKDPIRIELSLFTNKAPFSSRYLLFVNLSGLSRADTPYELCERRTGFGTGYLANDRTSDIDLCTRHSNATPLLVKVDRASQTHPAPADYLGIDRRLGLLRKSGYTRCGSPRSYPTGLPKRHRAALIHRIANEARLVHAFRSPGSRRAPRSGLNSSVRAARYAQSLRSRDEYSGKYSLILRVTRYSQNELLARIDVYSLDVGKLLLNTE